MKKMIIKKVLSLITVLCLISALGACNNSPAVESDYSDSDWVVEGDDGATNVQNGDLTVSDNSEGGNKDSANKDKNNATDDKSNSSEKDNNTSDNKQNTGNKPDSSDNGGSNNSNTQNNTSGKFDPYAGIENEKGKSVTFYTWWELKPQEKQVVKDFSQKYKISVNLEYTSYEEYTSKVTAAISSGQGPDVVALLERNYLNIIKSGLVQPLSKGKFDLKNDKKLDLQVMDAFKWNNQYYGINIANNMTFGRYVIYYNKTMFQNMGVTDPGTLYKNGKWNWDTFADCAKKMTRRVNGKTIYGYTGLDTTIAGWLLSAGGDYVSIDGSKNKITNNLLNDKVLKTYNFISGLRKAGYWSPDEDTNSFATGEAAMMGDTTWMFESDSMPKMTDNWSAVPMPSPKDQKQVYGVTGAVWGLATGCKNTAAASYFIRYWLDEDNSDLTKCIEREDLRKLFVEMSDTKINRKVSVSRSVLSYYAEEDYWQVLRINRKDVNDIPVALKSQSSKIDSQIKQILK